MRRWQQRLARRLRAWARRLEWQPETPRERLQWALDREARLQFERNGMGGINGLWVTQAEYALLFGSQKLGGVTKAHDVYVSNFGHHRLLIAGVSQDEKAA